MSVATLEGWFYAPLSVISGGQVGVERLREQLTYLPKFSEEGDEPVRLYDDSRPGFIGVPRSFGKHWFAGLPYEDRRSMGYPITVGRLPDPHHPSVKDPQAQLQFRQDLLVGMRTHEDMIASAATGSGKTVCSLATAAELGGTTLVLLHLGRLLDQWYEEIPDKLGIPQSEVGMIRADRCEYEGKKFVVAMLHSLVSRGLGGDGYPIELRDHFRTVIADEVHKMGTNQFAPVMPMFNSYYRLGLSATVEREDGGDRVFFWHIGPIHVTSTAEALECDVHVLDYDCGPAFELWGQDMPARSRCLAQDPRRNALLARTIKRFYDTGRQALIVGDGVLHLQTLMDMAERLGVPRSAMGQFTGDVQTVTWEWDLKTRREKRKIKKRKLSKAELDGVKSNSQLIFATYGMMTEGIDIPRLDAGLDVTPRGKATQLIGRIRRPRPGKKRPVWITVRDIRCSLSKRAFFARCRDYAASGAEVFINGRSTRQPRRGTIAAKAQAWSAQAPHARTGARRGR
ncbi:DEAD/DEAH box helicase family protein (plasmid) [Rhizobium bangladeshense]|uniref:DEAD/DEAH box helicase n=1 Tax=Rhizobium bangladeshense TaxID=1138189 RepID=UPI001A98260E|nr:DEAD/DEAH box helicase family protein [Rhizobium bangladeshense]QSY98685.1 DEAD/DEAH box helicase family protein [Rhizobium bangladeshense]